MINVNDRTHKIVFTALFAAFICVTTGFILHIPTGTGYIHIGDSLIYIAGGVLPKPYAAIAAAVGGGMADGLTGYHIYIIPTMLIKPLNALCFSNKSKIVSKRNIIGAIISGVITCVGYCAASFILFGDFKAAASTFPGNAVQAAGSAAVYMVIGAALDKAKVFKKI